MNEDELAELEKEIGYWSGAVNPRRKSIAQALVAEVRRLREALKYAALLIEGFHPMAGSIKREEARAMLVGTLEDIRAVLKDSSTTGGDR